MAKVYNGDHKRSDDKLFIFFTSEKIHKRAYSLHTLRPHKHQRALERDKVIARSTILCSLVDILLSLIFLKLLSQKFTEHLSD